ncbi:LPS assembly protein LptD [Paraglaciecola aquimarina]|uniref:LPS-assembly protein LptD n=1 Tax=Paraglaciecola algarum TaxID=3050085 RepID=A0ABS9DBG3_9ALTE|nr:LPS assembly protein LptD [Paraglaciecola sp. G1-23]MCF2949712.1 LPS assembly protein LptD [Paraglaciecola sp. G1-23]
MSSIQNTQFSLCLLLSMTVGLTHAQEVCFVPAPDPNLENSLLDGQIQVKSQDSEINQDTFAKFKGNVEIDSKQVKIKADEAIFDRQTQTVQATGNVSFLDQHITVSSEKIELNRSSNELLIDNSEYTLNKVQGHGQAEKIAIGKQSGINLIESSFSSCPVDNQVWRIQASNIELTPNQARGIVKHARFYIKDVPVLYLPYFSFPVNDQRQSGILYPSLKSNSATGISIEQPVYWNIAPNYDLTLSPRVMTKRGLQLKTEFRYLTEQHTGQVNLEYLANDKELADNTDRYFYRFIHSGQISENWHINADLNGLSDDNYIVDLGSNYYNRADTHLYKTLGMSYFSEDLSLTAQFRDFEVLGDHPDSYRALPEIRLDYLTDLPFNTEFEIHSELAYFESAELDNPTATRFHIAPTLRFPYQNQWSEFLAEATVMHTHYLQENIQNTTLNEEVTRTIGQAKIYGAMAFERPINLFGIQMTQTLEPKAQYLYTSFQDQSDIGLYDTTQIFKNFSGLFRGQEFTGLDRISDNNQITLGLTSRIIDNNNQEQFKLSLGQIFYLSDSKITGLAQEQDRSALAAELDWQIGSKWYAHTEAQVSTSTDKIERSSVSLEYQLSKNKILQINHRFIRDLSSEEINQVGVTASWPLSKNWQWVGRWYQDTQKNRTVETYTGVKYESCCWTVSLVAQRHLSNRFDLAGTQSTDEFESGFHVYFTSRNLLRDGLFGYRRPYLLN